MSLQTFIGKQVLGVLAFYRHGKTIIHICCVYPLFDNSLKIFFPRGHSLVLGDFATIHLDNRTGVYEFDSDIKVYRASYKGHVSEVDGDWLTLTARECIVVHGMSPVLSLKEPGYEFPKDCRPERAISKSPLNTIPKFADKDFPNKVGVLVTEAIEQPHTTVLAFLSSEDDDIFLITFPETFKSKLLKRSAHCYFVMDERASYTFEKSIEWNYTIIEGEAYSIERSDPVFEEVRQAFIDKNPWELPFFIRQDLEMYHIKREKIVFPGAL
ncbi:hypothetical protein [Paludibacterium paludis]|uniref:Uncharacterized protein n=1 Tax=Paludibacterium paludis TaxID=1225769 RepID=A0A918P633_9NEIS|nr:hypothetical protein [Paludibacterium paludis]GGY24465.1 hypothetical protein GCM10011289_30100 [Paludibacterium paludis]